MARRLLATVASCVASLVLDLPTPVFAASHDVEISTADATLRGRIGGGQLRIASSVGTITVDARKERELAQGHLTLEDGSTFKGRAGDAATRVSVKAFCYDSFPNGMRRAPADRCGHAFLTALREHLAKAAAR
jgi:hypothetical protein